MDYYLEENAKGYLTKRESQHNRKNHSLTTDPQTCRKEYNYNNKSSRFSEKAPWD